MESGSFPSNPPKFGNFGEQPLPTTLRRTELGVTIAKKKTSAFHIPVQHGKLKLRKYQINFVVSFFFFYYNVTNVEPPPTR